MVQFGRFSVTLLRLAAFVIRSKKKETARAYALLSEIEKQLGGRFQPATRRKIAISYGLYNPMICDAFGRLHGRLTTDAEKERLIHYFICSSLFDDFTDHGTISEAQLLSLSFCPEDHKAVSFDEKAFQQSHLLLWNYVADKPAYEKVTKALYKAQLLSKEQHNSQLPDETLLDITFTKGGYSVLLCRYYLDLPANATEEACWYRIGTIIQLTNDLFDIYKDLADNIDTLPNRMTNAYVFEQFFREQMGKMDGLIRQLPYGRQRIQGFRLAMSGIYGLGLVAIDQLKAIQGDQLQLPDFGSLPRKALIVDMEKTRNLVKCLRHAYKSWRY
ncbi:hypothetical protein [Filimonas effusa]|uniref:Class 1 isoprenoid biosynthesis enzyme n=1 Tax=Filimonas effusa TaxID=2508721 RepID=A0A4Q1D9U2_9BACT|nr:hypothetical protein [Filimonas effusa]RXK86152.1 hypothetical protein ESB13_04900 [Filimonas effusa]